MSEQYKIYKSRFRAESLLGEGSNGKTWLGTDIISGQKVAIKTLKLSAAENLKSFELFEREAAVLASVQTDGVPKFYDSHVAETADDESYIVQEYIDAPSIDAYLKQCNHFNEQDTLWIIFKVALILHDLHTSYTPPIIHRDIKPGNIMCRVHAEGGMNDFSTADVYLIDFGAVANPQKSSGGSTVAGTFGYMAPEQYMGTVSPQSDIYSLGATAIHMVTGCAPYELTSDVFKLQYKDKLREVAPNTSEHFIELIDKIIDPEPAKRPATVQAVAEAAQRVLHGLSPWTVDSGQAVKYNERPSGKTNFNAKNMMTTKGIIRSAKYVTASLIMEYTFKANGKEWCGVYEIIGQNAGWKENQTISVIYNPDNPTINRPLGG